MMISSRKNTRRLALPALLATAAALLASPFAASAAVTCTLKSITASGDTGTPDYYNTALYGTIATRVYAMQMDLTNTTSTQEQVGMGINWFSGGGTSWVAAANATTFVSRNDLGIALRSGGASGAYVQPSAALLSSQQNIAGRATISVTWYAAVELKRTGTVVAGAFGMLSSPYAFGAKFYNRSSAQWEYISGCQAANGTSTFPSASGVAAPPPPAANPVVCTINGGAPFSASLPQVQAINMVTIGALPKGYPKQSYPLRYACTGTGSVTNPAYTIALAGTKGGTTNALASDKTNVGVMVEAITSRGEGPTVMVPGTTTDYAGATKVPLRDAGQSGGSVMTLVGYPVRTAAGTIQPGTFKATGTLKVFTE